MPFPEGFEEGSAEDSGSPPGDAQAAPPTISVVPEPKWPTGFDTAIDRSTTTGQDQQPRPVADGDGQRLDFIAQHAGMDPDRQAKVLKLADEAGVHPDLVDANLDGIQSQIDAQNADWTGLAQKSPRLAAYLSGNPRAAATAKGDEGKLLTLGLALERVKKAFVAPWGHPGVDGGVGEVDQKALEEAGASLSALPGAAFETLRAQAEFHPAVILHDALEEELTKARGVKLFAVDAATQNLPPNARDAIRGVMGQQETLENIRKDNAAAKARREQFGGEDFGSRNPVTKAIGEVIHMAPWMIEDKVARAIGGVVGAATGLATAATTGVETGGAGVAAGAAEAVMGQYLGSGGFNYLETVGQLYPHLLDYRDPDTGKPLDPAAVQVMTHLAGVANGVVMSAGLGLVSATPIAKKLVAEAGEREVMKWLEGGLLRAYGKHIVQGTAAGVTMMGAATAATGSALQESRRASGLSTDYASVAHDVWESMKAAIPTMALMSGLHPLVGKAIEATGKRRANAEDQVRLEGILQSVEGSRMAVRAPDELGKAVEAMAPDQTFGVPAARFVKYFQEKKVDPAEVANKLFGDGGKALQDAVASGGDLAIPAGKAVAVLNEGGHLRGLQDDIRMRPEGMTANEVMEEHKRQVDIFTKAVEARRPELDRDMKPVAEFIRDSMLASGSTKTEARHNAELWSGYVLTQAVRAKTDVGTAAREMGFENIAIDGKTPAHQKAAAKFLEFLGTSAAAREQVEKSESMSPQRRAELAYLDPKTGALSAEAAKQTPLAEGMHQGLLTIQASKPFNDSIEGGHNATNDLLAEAAKPLYALHPDVAREGTDFLFPVDSETNQEQIDAAVAAVKAHLPEGLDVVGVHAPTTKEAFIRKRALVDERRAKAETEPDWLPARGKFREGVTAEALKAEVAKRKGLLERPAAKVPEELVKKVGAMSGKEFYEKTHLDTIYQHDKNGNVVDEIKTGLLSRIGYEERPDRAYSFALDVKGLGDMPKEVGDGVLRRVAQALAESGGSVVDAAHLSGDEFAGKHDRPEVLRAVLEGALEHLKKARVEYDDPKTGAKVVKPVEFRYDLGISYDEADRNINRQRANLRNGPERLPGEGVEDFGGREGVGGGRGRTLLSRAPLQAHPDTVRARLQQEAVARQSVAEAISKLPTKERAFGAAWLNYVNTPAENRPSTWPDGMPDSVPKALSKAGVWPVDAAGEPEAWPWNEQGKYMGVMGGKRSKGGQMPEALRRDLEQRRAFAARSGDSSDYKYNQQAVAHIEGTPVTLNQPARTSVADIEAKIAKDSARIEELDAQGKESYRFSDKDPTAGPLMVSRDPSKPGKWRMTFFGKDGEPYGHQETATRIEAIRRAKEFGADIHEGAPVKLEQGPKSGEGDETRGSISMQFDPTGRSRTFLIDYARGDKSTFMHEMAHFASWGLHDLANSVLATPEIKADYKTLIEWAGYEHQEQRMGEALKQSEIGAKGEAATPEEKATKRAIDAKEERISHGFEQYLMEGKAPTRALAAVFSRFRGWMLKIYTGLSGVADQYKRTYGQELGLSDEVRGVFARMLSAEQALEQAREEAGPPDFDVQMAATREEWANILKLRAQAQAEGEMSVAQAQAAAESERVQKVRANIEEHITEETDKQPLYNALRFLEHGTYGDPKAVSKEQDNLLRDQYGKALKLNRAKFEDAYGEEVAAKMPPGSLKKGGGLDADTLAGIFNLGSGDDLVNAIKAAEPRDALIARKTQEAVDQTLGPEKARLDAAAMSGIHNDAELRAAIEEQRVRAKQINPAYEKRALSTDLDNYRRMAKERVGGLKVAELAGESKKFTANEKKLGLAAAEKQGAGDKAGAYDLREQQIANRVLYMEARDSAKELDSARNRMEHPSAAVRANLGKADPAYRDVYDQLLAAVKLGDGPPHSDVAPKTLDEMLAVAAGEQEMVFDVQRIRQLLEQPQEWDSSLSVDDARKVADAATNIRTAAKRTLESTVLGKTVGREMFTASLVDSAKAARPNTPRTSVKEASGVLKKLGRFVQAVDGNLLNIAGIANLLDGGNRDGPWHALLLDSYFMNRDKTVNLSGEAVVKLQAEYDKMPKAIRRLRDQALTPEQKALHPMPAGEVDNRTRSNLYMVQRNMGNDGNQQRLLDGYGWDAHSVRRALATLTPEELDWNQHIMDVVDSLKRPAFDAAERETGIRPEEVEATPLTINGVTRRGGYWPAKADTSRSSRADQQELAGAMSSKIRVDVGHTLQRAERNTAPLDLNEAVTISHIAKVIHQISMSEYVKDVDRLLSDQRVKDVLKASIGERAKELDPWLRTVANRQKDAVPDNLSNVNKLVQFARNRATIQAVGYSLQSAAAVTTDPALAVSMGLVRGDYLGIEAVKAFKPGMHAEAVEKFPELKARELQRDRNLKKVVGEMVGDEGVPEQPKTAIGRALKTGPVGMGFEKAGDAIDAIRDTAFWFHTQVDQRNETMLAWARYHQSIAEGKPEAMAVRDAEDVVRASTPAHDPVMQSQAARGKGLFGLLMFYGYTNQKYNMVRRDVERLYRVFTGHGADGETRKMVVGTVVAHTMAYLATVLVAEYLSGRGPEKNNDGEREDFADWAMRKAALEHVKLIPGLSTMAEGGVAIYTGHRVSVRNAPVEAFGEDVLKRIQAATKSHREGDSQPLLDLAGLLGGAVLGAPANALEKPLAHQRKLEAGTIEDRGPLDTAAGWMYGDRKGEPANPLSDLQTAISGPK